MDSFVGVGVVWLILEDYLLNKNVFLVKRDW